MFVIVGSSEPLYEAEFLRIPGTVTPDSIKQYHHFILHSSLDMVDKAQWTTNNMYLRNVDRVNNLQVASFVTAGNMKMLLLHGGRPDDSLRSFFMDVYETYVKYQMNPFAEYDKPIASKAFDSRVRASARKHLS